MRSAANTAEALSVYQSMQQFSAQLEEAAARRQGLERSAAAATLHVTLQASGGGRRPVCGPASHFAIRSPCFTTPAQVPEPKLPSPPPPPPPPSWSPFTTLSRAAALVVRAGMLLVDVAIYAAAFALPVGAALVLGSAAWGRVSGSLRVPGWYHGGAHFPAGGGAGEAAA